MRRAAVAAIIIAALLGCTPVTSSAPSTTTTTTTTPATTTTSVATTTTPPATSTGWELTVYYTAVESYHSGPTSVIRGCPDQDCAFGNKILGTYPKTFSKAVKDEGTGRTKTPGVFLNWSYDVGYWLDTLPANTNGEALRPFISTASDGLRLGDTFRLVPPLRQDTGEAVDPAFSALLLAASWDVEDEFTPGLGGPKHIDLYIGEEDRVNFKNGPRYITMVDAGISR